jgi:branched-chain amino acid transport system substrate-binding protein
MLSVTAIVLAACSGGAGSTEPIKIGSIADLTGPTSDIGVFGAAGTKAYFEWKNENGGISGRKIEFLVADYEYKVPKAEELYAQFVTQQKSVAFIGWGTGDTEAMRPKITADKIPFMSASYAASLGDPKDTPYNFLVAPSYSDQLVVAQQYVVDQAKKAGKDVTKLKFAYLINNSPFGKSPVDAGKAHAKANGIADPLEVPSQGPTADHTPQLTQIKDYGATHVFFQNVPSPPAKTMRDAKALGLTSNIQFFCLNYCSHELFIKLAGDASENVLGVIPYSADAEGAKVPLDYAKKKGINLANGESGFVQGWYFGVIMTEGIERTVKAGKPLTGENIKASLESLKDFSTGGVSAPITFTATDHRGTRAIKVYQVKGGKWTAVSDFITAK